jgi:folate-binding protein YgfZ
MDACPVLKIWVADTAALPYFLHMENDYGDWLAEYKSLHETVGVLDLSERSRICLVGNDRLRFLHGQVTNDVKKLRVDEGCYAAIVTAKGKMESDVNIFNLQDELLLDFEPGLTEKISQRLERFIVADDVQIVDAAPYYGLLSVQGPKAQEMIRSLNLFPQIPANSFHSIKISDVTFGEIYLANLCRSRDNEAQKLAIPYVVSYNLFVPKNFFDAFTDKMIAAAKNFGGCKCGWQAFETVRVENGIPRFGADMDETNIPLESGIESRAVSYNKGCYIGQEVINRIHSVGHVNKTLQMVTIAEDIQSLPNKGDKLFHNGKEVGYVTSAIKSPALGNIALGYVRREANQIGTELILKTTTGESAAKIVESPFAFSK